MDSAEFLKVEAAATVLKAAAAAGSLGKDAEFVGSLLKSYAKYASLSPKQLVWFYKLADKHSGKPEAVAPLLPAPSVGAFEGVYSLFAKAKEKLKFPKINLSLADGSPVVLNMAGPKSKKPGVINVTNGGKFATPGNKWYGRVNPDGSLESGVVYAEHEEVKSLLSLLAGAPAKVAADYAKLSGRCCFCNKTLTDKHSTAVGYGETCAHNFGLHPEWKAGVSLFESLVKEEVSGLAVAEEKAGALVSKPAGPLAVEALSEAGAEDFVESLVKADSVPTPLIPIPGLASITGLHMLAKAAEEKAVEDVVKVSRPAKPVVTVVPGVKKDDDYLF